jgi:hypothetical protein
MQMLAYYLEWDLRQKLAPILFDDDDKPATQAARRSIVAPAQRSPAKAKAATKQTQDGLPVHSFRSLLAELATFTRNTMIFTEQPEASFVLYPELTPTQARAFQLLGVPCKAVASNGPPKSDPS